MPALSTKILLLAALLGRTASAGFAQVAPGRAATSPVQTLAGVVLDDQNQPVVGAAVSLSGTVYTTSTDRKGQFALKASFNWPANVVITHEGFVSQDLPIEQAEAAITVELERALYDVGQTTWAASRREENTFKVPITLDHLTADRLAREVATDAVFGALGRLRGVDVTANSLLSSSISTRGFNSTQTYRFVQLTDNADLQLPSLGVNVGNVFGAAPLDIETLDLIHGSASTFYGVNAFNGVLVTTTKDPFQTPGLSVALRGGSRTLQDAQVRYAMRFNSRFAAKLNVSYFSAKDFTATNEDAQQAAIEPNNNLRGDLRGYNAINRYGDVGYTYGLDGGALNGQRVFMPGWTEQQTVGADSKALNIRVNPSLSYLLTPDLRATYEYRYSRVAGTLQTTDRFRLDDVDMHLHRFELRSTRWAIRAFQTRESGKGIYSMTQLGAALQNQLDPRTNGQLTYAQNYFTQYQQGYNAWLVTHPGDNGGAAAAAAAGAADVQLNGDSEAFTKLHDASEDTPQRAGGTRQPLRSNLADISGQYDFALRWFNLQVGGSYRRTKLVSDGSLFANAEGTENTTNYQYGGYAEASKTLADRRLRLTAAARYDGFQNFGAAVSPRLAGIFLLGAERNHAVRASFGQSFAAPTQPQQFIRQAAGDRLILGNITNGFSGYSLRALKAGADIVAEQVSYDKLRLEKTQTVEVGYRTLLGKRLLLDLTGFETESENLVAQALLVANEDGSRPKPADLATVGQPGTTARVVQTWYNADRKVDLYGATVEMRWFASAELSLWANYAYMTLGGTEGSAERNLALRQFSTPTNKVNVGLTGTAGALRYDVAVRWIEGFESITPFAEAQLPERTLIDVQLEYVLGKTGLRLNGGATNLADVINVSVAGAPSFGRQLFAGLRYDFAR